MVIIGKTSKSKCPLNTMKGRGCFKVTRICKKRVWLHCRDEDKEKTAATRMASEQVSVIGVSHCQKENSIFPHSGLIPALHAAMRGDIDILIVENSERLGQDFIQTQEFKDVFESYGVSVRSFNNAGNNNS